MKKIILALVIVVMVSTPCLAEVETESLFSVDGTLWIACARRSLDPPPYNCDKELGFYQGKVYGNFRTLDPFYYDLGVVSYAWEHQNRLNFFFAIMLPNGSGVFSWHEFINPSCARCTPPLNFYESGILNKIKDDWTPPEIIEIE